MANDDDYIPGGDEEFNDWQDNFMKVLLLIMATIGIPGPWMTTLQGLQTNWVNAFSVGSKGKRGTRTSGQTHDKIDARKAYESGANGIRKTKLKFIDNNDTVTNGMLADMELPIPDNIKSDIGAPDILPDAIQVVYKEGGQIIWYLIYNSKKSKPEGIKGGRVHYKIGGDPPASMADCDKTLSTTKMRSGIKANFTSPYAGMKIYAYFVYFNDKDQEGPPTSMKTYRVPE